MAEEIVGDTALIRAANALRSEDGGTLSVRLRIATLLEALALAVAREVEMLRAELNYRKGVDEENERLRTTLARQAGEVEKLREALEAAQPRAPEQAVGEVERGQALIDKWHIKAEEFKAEVERLQEALRPFAEYARALDDGSATRGIPNAAPVTYNPDRAYGSAINVGDLRKARAALAATPEPKLVECDQCGGTGFDTPGTGYGNVCSKCGGQRYVLAARAQAKDAT